MLITSQRKYKLSDKVILHKVGDEGVLLKLDTQEYYALNASGLLMIDKLIHSDSLEQAFDSLIDSYDSPPGEIHNDLENLMDDLIQQGIIEQY